MNVNTALFEQISSALDFIEMNLTEKINLEDIAKSAYLSLFHFSRVFQSLTQISPYDYLIRRRIHESALKLVTTDLKIIEIAYEYAFASPEVFNRAFKRVYNCQPNEFRKNKLFIPHLFRFNPEYLPIIHQNIKTSLDIVNLDTQIIYINPLTVTINLERSEILKLQGYLSLDGVSFLLLMENKAMPCFWSYETYDCNKHDNRFLYQVRSGSFLKLGFEGDALSLYHTLQYIGQIYAPRYFLKPDNLILFQRISYDYFDLYFQLK